MAKGKINKVVGVISDDIVDKQKSYDYRGREIVQSLDLYIHIAKHIKEFESVDSYNHAVSSIPEIISKPKYVYYDPNRNSLLYFKKIDENVCLVVKLKLRKNKDTYVATIYPINENKIQKYIELSYIVNRQKEQPIS